MFVTVAALRIVIEIYYHLLGERNNSSTSGRITVCCSSTISSFKCFVKSNVYFVMNQKMLYVCLKNCASGDRSWFNEDWTVSIDSFRMFGWVLVRLLHLDVVEVGSIWEEQTRHRLHLGRQPLQTTLHSSNGPRHNSHNKYTLKYSRWKAPRTRPSILQPENRPK